MSFTLIPLDNSSIQVSAMNDIRNTVANQSLPAFPYSFEFLFWEQYSIIDKELLQNLLLATGDHLFLNLFESEVANLN